MTDREELLIRAARMVELDRMRLSEAADADRALIEPAVAADVAWRVSGLTRDLMERLQVLLDEQVFCAKRYDRAQREETRTGREYRSPQGDAA